MMTNSGNHLAPLVAVRRTARIILGLAAADLVLTAAIAAKLYLGG
jgi:hypothetical protein